MEGAGSGATGGASTKKAADKEERVSTSHSKSSNAVIQTGPLQSLCSILHVCLLVSKLRALPRTRQTHSYPFSSTRTIMLISNHNVQAEGWTAEKAEDDGENMERGGDGEDGEKDGEEEAEEEGEAGLDFELPDTVTAGQVDRLLQGMSLEPERKHAAQDIFLALNNWAPAGQVSEPGDHDHDAWRQR
jgi:hypothetical protein